MNRSNILLVYPVLINIFWYARGNITKPWTRPPMRYIDEFPIADMFSDRIVSLTLDMPDYSHANTSYTHISIGVLISDNLVLTSYNPFRNLSKSAQLLSKIYVCFLIERKVLPSYSVRYHYGCAKTAYGRPVLPIQDANIQDGQWHGPDRQHSPLHDLMVIKLPISLNIWTPEKDYTYEERYSAHIQNGTFVTAGPLLTNLAKIGDNVTMPIKFSSLGLRQKEDLIANRKLESVEYNDEDNIIVDCEDWLPRDWRYFICLQNDPVFIGFSSGAMLFSNKMLFGIGCFTLWRGKESVLVFTDIRHYHELIINTCTDADLKP